MTRHKIGGHGRQCTEMILVDQHATGLVQLIVLHQAELAVTFTGPSDGRGTSRSTAASVAVLVQQSANSPFVILSSAVLPKDTAIISRWAVPRSKVCVCVRASMCIHAYVRACVYHYFFNKHHP